MSNDYKHQDRQQFRDSMADFYITWVNDWLTCEAYAEYHEMTVDQCTKMINFGRECQEDRAARYAQSLNA